MSDHARSAFFQVDTDGLAAIHRAHGRVFEGRDAFFQSAVEQSARFFDDMGVKATYMVIAEDLEDKEKQAALRGLVDAGHEMACHGFRHRYLDRSSTEIKREEIFDAKARIEDALGVQVRGFRAPGFSVDWESIELLGEAGYDYDSSVFPTFAMRERLGIQRLYPDPFEILPERGLMEFPLPVSWPGMPAFHPAYAFYLRRPYFRWALGRAQAQADHLTLLFHFTDFAEKQEDLGDLRLQVFTNNFFSADQKRAFLGKLVSDVRETYEIETIESFLDAEKHLSPRLRPRTILGISTTHETGAAVVRDGRILSAINEERLSRKKLDNRYPPEDSVREALRIAGIEGSEVDAIAIAGLDWRNLLPQSWKSLSDDVRDYHGLNDYFPHFVRLLYRVFYFFRSLGYDAAVDSFEREFGKRPRVFYVEHHSAHAASAFRTGEVDEATIVTADGVGDDICITVSKGSGRTIRNAKRFFYPNSFGQFYTACTQILGFKAGRHEGKITGLAGYGSHNAELLEKVESTFFERDGFRLGKRFYAEGFPRPRKGMLSEIRSGKPVLYAIEYRNYKKPLADLLEGYSREDVAWAFQHLLEREMVRIIPEVAGHSRNLALAGGVFANVKLNMAISQKLEPENLYVFPAMGDGGLCAGAALEVCAASPHPMPNAYLGTAFDAAEIDAVLAAHPELEIHEPEDLPDFVAEQLADEKIVARADGGMEYGPRALGNRSILYHCGEKSVNDWLNQQLDRTEFMPFAPMCIYEDADEYFILRPGEKRACEFMTLVVDCTDKMKDACPAAVHVDGTARPQLVRKDQNPGMYAILEAYKARTGISCTINTSFNMHEEPIVRTPEDAINAFQRSHLDWLVMGPYVVRVRDAVPVPRPSAKDSA